MAKHNAHGRHRKPLSTTAYVGRSVGGILAASLALSFVVPAPVEGEPHPMITQATGTAHAVPAVQRDAAGFELGCWIEPGTDALDGGSENERVCGSVNLAPADAYGFTTLTEQRQLDRREAAAAIADRLDSGQPMYEDWTWVGMPELVGAYNESLLDEWEAAGRPDASGWLESYAATWEV